jgi:hypothetical protein
VHRKTGVAIKTNVAKDSDNMDNVSDFFNDDEVDDNDELDNDETHTGTYASPSIHLASANEGTLDASGQEDDVNGISRISVFTIM